jgi:hypothetical protein
MAISSETWALSDKLFRKLYVFPSSGGCLLESAMPYFLKLNNMTTAAQAGSARPGPVASQNNTRDAEYGGMISRSFLDGVEREAVESLTKHISQDMNRAF